MEHAQTQDRETTEPRGVVHNTLKTPTEAVTVTKEQWEKLVHADQTLTKSQEKMQMQHHKVFSALNMTERREETLENERALLLNAQKVLNNALLTEDHNENMTNNTGTQTCVHGNRGQNAVAHEIPRNPEKVGHRDQTLLPKEHW